MGNPPGMIMLKPSKITVKTICVRRTTGNGQDDQVISLDVIWDEA